MDKFIMVEYSNNFKAISETFQSMNRIKVLSFDVSKKYFVFGASSGGIYIFNRFPCDLIKFIPSMEGSTLNLKISSDEVHLAMTNSRGLVVILENFFVDFTVKTLVQNEHEGTTVTAMNWHGNELYVGDNTGKLSVFSLAKAFFQNPSAVLLRLDSSIIQIDNFETYFLISTKICTYLCDGEKGEYKQIGEKARNGDYGACFYKESSENPIQPQTMTREIFKTVENNGEFTSLKNKNAKIFCSRPKGRLWEADFQAKVLNTYNFKDLPPSCRNVLLITDLQDSDLIIKETDMYNEAPVNFRKIIALGNRFVLTYDGVSYHIVDPCTSTLVFSKSNIKNLTDVQVLGSYIFIRSNGFEITVMSLQSLEEIVVNTLLSKQYNLSAEMCLHFKTDLIGCLPTSKRLGLLLILKSKLEGKIELLTALNPIFTSLESCYGNLTGNGKLEGGIVTVDNKYLVAKEEEKPTLSEEQNKIQDNGVDLKNVKIYCLYRQYDLNKFQKNAELIEYQNLVEKMNLDEILLLMEDFAKYVEEKETSDVSRWINEHFVKIASKKSCQIESLQPKTLSFLSDAFLQVNTIHLSCKCSFPLPKARKHKIAYCDIGIQLFNLLNDKKYYLNCIPNLYGHYLKECLDLKNPTDLRLFVQFSDLGILKEIKQKLTYDIWEDIVKSFIQLRDGTCLNCSENIDLDGIWCFNELGIAMMRSIGPKNSIRLLQRYSASINNGELMSSFFKSCIMTSAYQYDAPVMDFVEQHMTNCDQLNNVMERYLQNQYINRVTGNGMKLEIHDKLEKCSYCDLSLSGPILNQYKKCSCGISYHYLCYITNDKICNNCLSKQFT